jgi:ferritin-like metal-binding protein YciE
MDTRKIDKYLDQWLRDAHAMEQQAETMLSSQAGRIENYPELKQRIEQHLRETQSQRERIETCLQRRGTSTSGAKDLAAKFTAMMQGLSGTVMGDEVAKGAMASYTFEHFEISAYKILIASAELAGDTETARVCKEICDEEERMAGLRALRRGSAPGRPRRAPSRAGERPAGTAVGG